MTKKNVKFSQIFVQGHDLDLISQGHDLDLFFSRSNLATMVTVLTFSRGLPMGSIQMRLPLKEASRSLLSNACNGFFLALIVSM